MNTIYQYKHQRQEVTGLIVNDKVSVPLSLENELKKALYFISKYGYYSHKEHIQNAKTSYVEHLYGIAYYIKMVNNEKGNKYINELDEILW